MSDVRWLDDDEQRAWRGWLELNAELTTRLNRRLQASSGLSLADYDVLVALSDVPGGTLRMFELGERLQWSKSRLSKQLSRMTTRALVEREECADDRRGAFVRLTDDGSAAIRAAAPAHVAQVRRLVFDALSAEQVLSLAEITETLLHRARTAGDA